MSDTLSAILRHPRVQHPRVAPAIVTLLAVIALGGAFIAQYVFHLLPCVLCIYERWAYGAALAGGILGLVFARNAGARRAALWLGVLGFLAVAAISVYHVGVEQGWWTGSAECSGEGIKPGMSRDDLKNAILGAPKVACTDVAWDLWGISLAGFNVIFSPIFAGITLLLMRRRG
jgi:disulfide bond formation protein DsbB